MILLFSLTKGLLNVCGEKDVIPKDGDMEKLVVEAYKLAKKPLHRKIKKKQFINWAKSLIASDPSPCDFPELMTKFKTPVTPGTGVPAAKPPVETAPEISVEAESQAPAETAVVAPTETAAVVPSEPSYVSAPQWN